MKSLLDPTFRYTNSANTNIRKTFARVRREQTVAAAKRVAEKAREQDDTERVIDIFEARRK